MWGRKVYILDQIFYFYLIFAILNILYKGEFVYGLLFITTC